MSAIMPVELARRIFQSADDTLSDPAPYMDQAREELIDKLVAGRRVNGTTSRDIFDCARDNSDVAVLDLLEAVLALNNESGDDRKLSSYDVADKAAKIIAAFVDSKPEWIWERACEIANDDEDTDG